MIKVSIVDKFLTKENIVIVVLVFYTLIQSNYFATKLDLANLKLEMNDMQAQLKEYSDNGDKELQKSIESKFQIISNKLDKLR